MDYPAHVRTYNRFINFLQSMIAHLAFLVMALYFFIIAHNPVVGTILLVIAVLVLLYGLFRNPAINRDFNQALDTEPVLSPGLSRACASSRITSSSKVWSKRW